MNYLSVLLQATLAGSLALFVPASVSDRGSAENERRRQPGRITSIA